MRNYQARNCLRQMAVGDLGLFYHSNTQPPHVAGVLHVTGAAVPDNLQFDAASPYFDPRSTPERPRWSMVEVEAVTPLAQPVTLAALRELPAWAASPLVQRGNRLSVMPLTAEEFAAVLSASGTALPE